MFFKGSGFGVYNTCEAFFLDCDGKGLGFDGKVLFFCGNDWLNGISLSKVFVFFLPP